MSPLSTMANDKTETYTIAMFPGHARGKILAAIHNVDLPSELAIERSEEHTSELQSQR